MYRLQDQITLGCMSGPWLEPLALRDTYQMRHALGKEPFIIGSGGVYDLDSAVRQIMVGADAVWVCTETMIRGFDWLPKVLEGLEAYMKEMGFAGIRDFRDLLHKNLTSARRGSTIHKGQCRCGLGKMHELRHLLEDRPLHGHQPRRGHDGPSTPNAASPARPAWTSARNRPLRSEGNRPRRKEMSSTVKSRHRRGEIRRRLPYGNMERPSRGAEVAAVVDLQEEARNAFKEKYGIRKTYSDLPRTHRRVRTSTSSTCA